MSIETIGQIASFAAPAVIVIGGLRWLAHSIWTRFEAKFDESQEVGRKQSELVRSELMAHAANDLANQLSTQNSLDRIEEQTSQTNGRVGLLELQASKVEGILIGKKESP